MFVGTVAIGVAVWTAASNLPSFEELKASPNGQMIRVLAADGTEIVSIGPSFGDWLEHDEIPQVMKDAMIAVEDRRFESHFGIDPVGLTRAGYVAIQNYGTGKRMQGASTITQQLARNIFLSNSYTLARKGREAILAMALESKFSKDQILELYLNKVYFGGGAYGIDSASRKFFNHSANEISLAEAAIIAGLVKAPSRYSPTADAQAAVDRASVVLEVMQDAGAITAAQAAETRPAEVTLAPEGGQNSARYFTDWALPQLDMLIDEGNAPIEVWTTLDLTMQRAGTNAIKAHAPGGAQGALVSIDRDGAVRAMVGGTDYVTSNYNRATTAMRQPGSAWKLFVYMAALEAGYTNSDIVTDEPVTIAGWTPRNSGGRYAGDITLRTAFAYSKNTVAAQLGDDVGYGTIANMARRFGITTPIKTTPSMVLGASEVRVIDMTRAFAGVSQGGVAIEPYGISKVTTIDGEVLYQRKRSDPTVLVPPYVAAGITDLLQTAVNTGTGRAAQIGRPVAGKTGTTNSNKDGWFLGFSSGLTTGVWMGRDDAKAVGGLQGGRAPARAFADFMRVAVARRPVEEFDTEVVLPDWQLEPDEEAYFGDASDTYFVDENGNPIALGEGDFYDLDEPEYVEDEPRPQPQTLDERWIDRATGRRNDTDGEDSASASEPQDNDGDNDNNAPNRGQPESLLPNAVRQDGG
ncbi:PBP1A family penicillin-binding protein [Parasphingorhabdus sp. SCSIO 66989]|uniref:PBP1A family penicillin-binding protein n=2 Tax=Alterisphingorhabdus coralli TaxID=3071408 RepID=A0AA97F9R4_9SPHN|nr:PBP1A family penicillin-binding protein [Parasphingorhabdus sp. SCSIO 66989]WOE76588.1 PBP1A family penicillin-binding protein [Parasphingorhabdus sp. SCSIO 66989]